VNRRIRSLGRAAARLDQELFERSARGNSAVLDQTLPRLTRAADHGAHRVPISPSFPSGHAASAAAFATSVAITVPAAAIPVGTLAIGVAYSRVHTGMHCPGDVAAGVLLGAGVGILLGRHARRGGR
jgi:membrane-associated phospholipid phosphatase